MYQPDSTEGWRTFEDSQIILMPTLEQLVESLTKSTYLAPAAVDIKIRDESEGEIPFKIVVTSLEAIYVGVAALMDQAPVGCYLYPDYHFKGWLLKSGYDPHGGVVIVRGELNSDGQTSDITHRQLSFSPPRQLDYLKER